MQKFRIWICSLAARGGPDCPRGEGFYAHYPVAFFAINQQHVAELAKTYLFTIWPTKDGWTNHEVMVTPIPAEFFTFLSEHVDALEIVAGTSMLFTVSPDEEDPIAADPEWPGTIH